ncbi:alanine racemase [Pseudidiomarina taiwanensis]|uniref:Alanine racemase n=1 Tax=Pseudidiomarina taiwanensis TaxID=337250 RepID=A0A432ZEH2_9GAMM|nr:alanine racemase [Pseudidiomarina taiwanensis]RUO76321.1 alanine racemase [Pseudidiomarina taiwanensis]
MANGIHFRSTRAEINRDALVHNAREIKTQAGDHRVLGVIKADAYGHGLITAAQALDSELDAFGVAFIDEALRLREAGIIKPVVLLEGILSGEELPICAHYNLQPVIHQQSQLDALLTARLVRPVAVWLKVDTGLHRLGWPPEQVKSVYQQLRQCPNVGAITLMSHYANSGDHGHPLTQAQQKLFEDICAMTEITVNVSMANSAALLTTAVELSSMNGEWMRTGITIYGLPPSEDFASQLSIQPVMRLIAPVIALRTIPAGESVGYGSTWTATRESRIATIAIGYGDGYPRHCKNGTPVFINGQRAPLAGTVSMDMITVDVTDLDKVEEGDEVELWGPNLSVNEIAKWADTIGYELLTRVSPRVPRVAV